MRFINPLTMLQQALLSQPGGAPVPQVPMNIPAQMNFPTVPMTAPSQQLTAPDPRVDTSYNPAPQYYGPMHQKIADYFNAGSMWRTQFPQYVNQLMFDPEKVAMHSGSTIRDVIAPQPNNDWRINWFPATQEGDAAKNAVSQTGGLLMRPLNSYLGQNSVDFGSASGATGADGVGGVGAGVGTGEGVAGVDSGVGVGGNDGSSGVAW